MAKFVRKVGKGVCLYDKDVVASFNTVGQLVNAVVIVFSEGMGL